MKPFCHHVASGRSAADRTKPRLQPLLGAVLLPVSGSPWGYDALEFVEGFKWEGGQTAHIAVSEKNGSGRNTALFQLDFATQRPASLRSLPAASAVRLSGAGTIMSDYWPRLGYFSNSAFFAAARSAAMPATRAMPAPSARRHPCGGVPPRGNAMSSKPLHNQAISQPAVPQT